MRIVRLASMAFAVISMTLLQGNRIFAAEKSVQVGLHKQLLVDDHVIAHSVNLSRSLGLVTKANGSKPIICEHVTRDGVRQPVEVWPLFASIYYDAQRQRFRMWHRFSFNDPSREKGKAATVDELGVGASYFRGYSESKDGIHFELVAPLEGLTTGGDTNLVVTIDDHESDPAHRYKIGYDCLCKVNGAALAHSADGIHWTPYNEGQPVTYRAADFTNQVLWVPEIKAYRLLTRTDFGWGGGPFAATVDVPIGNKHLEVRGVRSMTNPDIKTNPTNWTLEQHWLFDGEEQLSRDQTRIEERLKDPAYLERVRKEALRRQVYAMTEWIYEGIHFGLMPVLEYPTDVSEGLETDHATRHERSIENYYIATSRDGLGWNFHWVYAGQPLVPRGPAGAWDKDMLFPTSQIITHDDKHWIFYGGNNERHGSAEKDVWFVREGGVGLAWLRLDGFVALEAGDQPGTLTTKPFRLDGSHLQLNVDAHAGGQVRVEVLDEGRNPIPEYSGDSASECQGVDSLKHEVAWKNQVSLAQLNGRTVRLKIHLKQARLYAFQIVL